VLKFLLVVILIAWLIVNFIKDPYLFIEVFLIGITVGATWP